MTSYPNPMPDPIPDHLEKRFLAIESRIIKLEIHKQAIRKMVLSSNELVNILLRRLKELEAAFVQLSIAANIVNPDLEVKHD